MGRKSVNKKDVWMGQSVKSADKTWLQSQEGDKARISQDDGVKEGGREG